MENGRGQSNQIVTSMVTGYTSVKFICLTDSRKPQADITVELRVEDWFTWSLSERLMSFSKLDAKEFIFTY